MNDFAYNPSTGWCRSSVEMKIIDLLEPVSLPTNNEDVRMLPVSNLPDRIATAVTDLIETIQNQLSAASGQEVRMTPYVYIGRHTYDKTTGEMVEAPSIFLKKDDRIRIKVDLNGVLSAVAGHSPLAKAS